jgi:hypothetical protein
VRDDQYGEFGLRPTAGGLRFWTGPDDLCGSVRASVVDDENLHVVGQRCRTGSAVPGVLTTSM